MDLSINYAKKCWYGILLMLLALGHVAAQDGQYMRFEAFEEVSVDVETDCPDAFITETAEDTLSMLVFTEKKKVYIVVYVYRFTGATEFVYNDQLHTFQISLANLEEYIDESGFYYCFVLELGALKEYAHEADNEVHSRIGLLSKSETVFTTQLTTTLQNGVKIAQYP